MTRIGSAARIQLLLWPRIQLTTWAVLLASFAANVAIFVFVAGSPSRQSTSGGLAVVYVFPLIFTMQSVVQVFPLAAGLGVTRRAFTLAVAGLGVVQAVAYGIVPLVLAMIEDATDGWGVRLRFFDYPGLLTGDRAVQLLVFVAAFLVVEVLGFTLGAVYKRWGLNGEILVLSSAGIALAVVGLLITWQHRWAGLLGWFGDRSVLTAAVALPLLLALLLFGGGWRVLRRAVP